MILHKVLLYFAWVCGFAAVPAALAAEVLPLLALGKGVYVIPAPLEDSSPANRGRVVNTGFIIGTKGVVVIDSGANHRHGEAILATIRKLTSKPVRLVVNTHPHPQNVLGNSAFAKRGIPILSSMATREKMDERCPRCLKALTGSIGEEAMTGTRIRLPDLTAVHGERMQVAGRKLRFFHFGHGHTEGDLLVLDEASGVLFAGDLIYRHQLPHLGEAHVSGWIESLNGLTELPFSVLVPGRGPVGDAGDVAIMKRYLEGLFGRIKAAYEKGLSADEAIERSEMPEFSAWQGYPERHGINIQHIYFEIERNDLEPEVGR